jgi:hypothetical protein
LSHSASPHSYFFANDKVEENYYKFYLWLPLGKSKVRKIGNN